MTRQPSFALDALAIVSALFALVLLLLFGGAILNYAAAVSIIPMGFVALAFMVVTWFEGIVSWRVRMHAGAAIVTLMIGGLTLLLNGLMFLPPVRDSLRSFDLENDGVLGIIDDDQVEHYLEDPEMRVHILRRPGMLKKLNRKLVEAPCEGTSKKFYSQLDAAPMLLAGYRAQNVPLETLVADSLTRKTLLLAAIAERYPSKRDLSWLSKLVQLTPAPSEGFKIGVMQAGTAQKLLGLIAARNTSISTEHQALLGVALMAHPGLVSRNAADGVFDSLSAQGGTPQLDVTKTMRKELRAHFGAKKSVGLTVSGPPDVASLAPFARRSMEGILESAGYKVTAGTDLRVSVVYGKKGTTSTGFSPETLNAAAKLKAAEPPAAKKKLPSSAKPKEPEPKKPAKTMAPPPARLRDTLVYNFSFPGGNPDTYEGSTPSDGKLLVNGRKIELPIEPDPKVVARTWLYDLPMFFLETEAK